MNVEPVKHGVLVVELADVVPRRHPDQPNLYVAITTMDLDERFDFLRRGATRPDWVRGNVRELRRDLSVETEERDRESASRLKRITVTTLKKSGYTVNRNTDIWTVYVIELDPAARKQPEGICVYVGETMKTPEERFKEHLSRATNGKTRLYSPVVARFGRTLRPDLAPQRTYYDKESSKRAEADWAEHLRSLGYDVRGGH